MFHSYQFLHMKYFTSSFRLESFFVSFKLVFLGAYRSDCGHSMPICIRIPRVACEKLFFTGFLLNCLLNLLFENVTKTT